MGKNKSTDLENGHHKGAGKNTVCACSAISQRSTIDRLQIEEEARHGDSRNETPLAGIHQRALR